MNLAIFLSMGESLSDMEKRGQGSQFVKFYLKKFAQNFETVFIFSYESEKYDNLPKNVKLIPNKYKLHRYIYAVLMPLIESSSVKKCHVGRTYHLSGTPPAIIAKILFNLPFVFNYAYDYKKFSLVEKKYFQYLLFFLTFPIASIFASKIFVASREKMNKSKKKIFLPNGVDTNFFCPVKNRKNMTRNILCVGRLEEQKNYINLIKALKGLNVRLTIIGSGKLKKKLKSFSKKQGVSLTIFDRIENTKMPKIYRSASLYVIASKIEGSPKSLLEAMSCARPVVGTNVQGIREIIKDQKNGILSGTEPESLSNSISKLLKDHSLQKRLGSNARSFVVENFELTKLINKEIETLKNIQ